jgi:clan AA aspartic protease (TIGR02281 family)
VEKLRISRISGLMFVDIEMWSAKENKYRSVALLLDTGASVTTVSDFILAGIGCADTGKARVVTTAGGAIHVRVKTIPKLKIGTTEIMDVEVYAHDFPDECFSDGVLGMNILEQFNFSVNLDDNIIELEKRG